MFFGLLFIILGLYIVYLLLEFLLKYGGDINKFGEKLVKRTVWLWLPLYGIKRLIKEVIFKKK